jgi:lysophospholipase L1-like esterase
MGVDDDANLTSRRVLAAALTLIVLAAAAVIFKHSTSRPDACKAHGSKEVTAGTPVAVVLGDSYSAGALLPNPRLAWPTLLGREEHWKTYVEGVGTTGVTTDGFCRGQNFLARLPMALAHHPEILVVQVGLNDTGAPPGAVRAKASELLRRASAVPQLDVVGPPPAPSKSPADLRRVDAELRAACQLPRCHYISALHWQLPYADGLHPSAAGHLQFATMVATALRRP